MRENANRYHLERTSSNQSGKLITKIAISYQKMAKSSAYSYRYSLFWCQKLSNNWKTFPKFTFHNELLISIKMILSCFTKVIHVVSCNYLFSLTCFKKYGSSFGSKAIIMIHAEGIEFSNLFACKFNMKWLDSSLNKTLKKIGLVWSDQVF